MHTPAHDHSRAPSPKGVEPPISVGSGFIALDMLLIGRKRVRANQRYAGGSCGNVLAILAHLDWNSYPVARLGLDSKAQALIEDFKTCRVNTAFVARQRTSVTPAIVVRLTQDDDGCYKSRFEWKDPVSGDWLPRYRPLPKSYVAQVTPQLPVAKVFYFDRAEPSSLLLATALREKGAVVFFEPSSCKDDNIFTACLAVSDIVKYSVDRIPQPPRNPISKSPRLEIQTLGASGLRYRLKLNSNVPGQWKSLSSFPATTFKDSTGCGDWCSAGIIHRLCSLGRENFMHLTEKEIGLGIRFGQALATINCEYEGARGPMYQLSVADLLSRVTRLLATDSKGTVARSLKERHKNVA